MRNIDIVAADVVEVVASKSQDDASADASVIVIMAVLMATGLFGLAMWRDLWSGRKNVPVPFLFGERGAKAIRSVYPFVGIPLTCFGAGFLAYGISVSMLGWIEAVAFIAFVALILILSVTCVLLGAIVLFNRPRFLVPPHARDFDGYLGDLARQFADRRRRH